MKGDKIYKYCRIWFNLIFHGITYTKRSKSYRGQLEFIDRETLKVTMVSKSKVTGDSSEL